MRMNIRPDYKWWLAFFHSQNTQSVHDESQLPFELKVLFIHIFRRELKMI